MKLRTIGVKTLNIVGFGYRDSKPNKYEQVKIELKSKYNNNKIAIIATVVPTICNSTLPC